MDSIEVGVRAELRTLAEFLQADVAALSRKLGAVVVESEPIYAEDQALVDVLVASAEGNLATLVQVFRYELDVGTVDAPPAAIHFARRLAQRGIPVSVLARAYRLGHQYVMAYFHEKLDDRFTDVELAVATYRHLSGIAFHYADRVTEQAIVAYDDEARMWLGNDAADADRPHQVIARRRPDRCGGDRAGAAIPIATAPSGDCRLDRRTRRALPRRWPRSKK
ncbi:hypothetical protein ABT187_12625 [Streptomyces sp. NPDC001817]|uniref:hypothetical protein n=1 Tax=Streptomyces sp. NPDC001817 TaxID=3154398 RepID=UPI003327D0FE